MLNASFVDIQKIHFRSTAGQQIASPQLSTFKRSQNTIFRAQSEMRFWLNRVSRGEREPILLGDSGKDQRHLSHCKSIAYADTWTATKRHIGMTWAFG